MKPIKEECEESPFARGAIPNKETKDADDGAAIRR